MVNLYDCEIKFSGTLLADDVDSAKKAFLECLLQFNETKDYITVKKVK